MIAHFTMDYDKDICNSLTELWENDCLKEQQKSVDILTRKGIGILITLPLNSVTTLRKRKPKQESKQNNDNNNNRRTQDGRRQNRY